MEVIWTGILFIFSPIFKVSSNCFNDEWYKSTISLCLNCLLKLLFCGCQIITILHNCFLHQNTPFENHKNQICSSSPRIHSWQATLFGAVSLFTLGSLLSSRSFPKIVLIRNAHSVVSAFLLLDSDKKWGAFRYIQKVGFWFKNRKFPRLWK